MGSYVQVTIDGVPYVPACNSGSRIGIAVTTHNRPAVLAKAIEQHLKHFPAGAQLIVIDDGSAPATTASGIEIIRHEKSLGIVASKNRSLEALIDAGCEHLFLWDDDAYPISDNWHVPYVESSEPHLAYQFLDLAGAQKLKDIAVLYRDEQHIVYTGQRGVMLYYHRSAIEKVGGFDPVYGRGMYEHPDLALRIHGGLLNMANNVELTTDKIVPLLTNVEVLRKEFETLPASISGSAQKVQNAFLAWVGGANDAVGASSSLSGVLDGLAKNIDTVANVTGSLVGLGIARYFGNMVGSVAQSTAAVISNTAAEGALAQAQVRGAQVSVATARQTVYRAQQARAAATSIEAQILAERNLATAQTSLNSAISGRSAAMNQLNNTASVMNRLGGGVLGLLGGWLGVIIAAGTAMYGLYQHTQQVHQEAVGFANNLDEINGKLQTMSVLGLKATAGDARSSLAAQKNDLADLDVQIESLADSSVFIEFGDASTDDELVIEGGHTHHLRCQE